MRSNRIIRRCGVRFIERPLADGRAEIAYTRTGPPGGQVVLVLPGGPGVASVWPYRGLRHRAARLGLDLVMVEHRGVGLSRAGFGRGDMGVEAVLDDIAAVLDAEGIDRVLIHGTSYGSYLAQGLGVLHPERVAGMILDSAMLSAGDMTVVLDELNRLYWHGTEATHRQAGIVRGLVAEGVVTGAELGFPLQLLHEFGGTELVDRALTLLRQGRGRRTWRWLRHLGDLEVLTPHPNVMEFDLAGEIAFRELAYDGPVGEWVLDVRAPFRAIADQFSPFAWEPFRFERELGRFDWPTVVLSGDRDLRAPRPVAERIVDLTPGAALVPVARHGHSALDTQPGLALAVMQAMVDGLTPATLAQRSWCGRPGALTRMLEARLALASLGAGRPGSG
ncbi:alpha/beta fold hydrolase [Arachnia propionica]|uniref:Alpha/beta fold hydrolase n=1 Tax=Arachnia propionica TaxID=1750 RepID=A0A3P1WTA9_9ACTN|nr:alpha/beta fold hydrolase [Arachnia propionica]RRD49401.1 alpha/beta fold hydrolase [Arachnia propionica]